MAELSEFDVLSFSETWHNPAATNDDISLLSYHLLERKDRTADSHGGVRQLREILSALRSF